MLSDGHLRNLCVTGYKTVEGKTSYRILGDPLLFPENHYPPTHWPCQRLQLISRVAKYIRSRRQSNRDHALNTHTSKPGLVLPSLRNCIHRSHCSLIMGILMPHLFLSGGVCPIFGCWSLQNLQLCLHDVQCALCLAICTVECSHLRIAFKIHKGSTNINPLALSQDQLGSVR